MTTQRLYIIIISSCHIGGILQEQKQQHSDTLCSAVCPFSATVKTWWRPLKRTCGSLCKAFRHNKSSEIFHTEHVKYI